MSIVGDGRTDGRTTYDGRRLDAYTISSPCEPNGSGELKRKMHAGRLELVDHVYSATNDSSAALPTAPGWNILIQMTKSIYVNFKSIMSNGKCHSTF